MITQASELLRVFIDEERKKIESFEMPHMPTLGNAYEEITKRGIDDFAIPRSLNLRVVSGFIRVGEKMLPQQIDCMLVEGEGHRYGLTEQFVYDIERVLCIFEVKKTLKKKDYIDAFDHLGAIRREFSTHFEKQLQAGHFEPDIHHARKSFAQITGRMAPERYHNLHRISKEDAMLFYALVHDSHMPASIVHGHGGYRTEEGLRAAFVDMIDERRKISGRGLGVVNFPSLVTSNEYCLIKANGHPYLVTQDARWVAVFSTRYNAAKIILEIVWAKIESHFGVRMPFGDDLAVEKVAPLLIAEPWVENSEGGWVYHATEYKERNLIREEELCWHPEYVGPPEMAAICLLAAHGGYLEIEESLDDYVKEKYGCQLTTVVENLLRTRIFAREDAYIRPISSCTFVLTNADDSGYVASDKNRFDAWCKENGLSPGYLNIIIY